MVISSSTLNPPLTTRDILSLYEQEVYDDLTEKREEYLGARDDYEALMKEIEFINRYNAGVESIDMDSVVLAEATMWDTLQTKQESLLSGVDLSVDEILSLEMELDSLRKDYSIVSDSIDYFGTLYTYTIPEDRISDALAAVMETHSVYEQSVYYGSLGDRKPLKPPVDGNYYISSLFGTRIDPLGSEGLDFHRGVDFAANYGTPVLSVFNGIVIVVDEHYGMGKYVRIEHGDGIVTSYLHLSEIDVVEGQEVSQYDVIGKVGSTGLWSTGNHLHFAISINGEHVDPYKLWSDLDV